MKVNVRVHGNLNITLRCRGSWSSCCMVLLSLFPQTEPKRVVMWHTFSEIQVLLRVDFHQTAIVRKDELIKRLWEKGDLKANVSQ